MTFFKLPLRFKNKIISKLINPNEKWGVAFTTNVNKRFSKWNQLNIDSNQDWHADPFFALLDKQLFIITEKFIYKKRKGVIFANPINFHNGKYTFGKGVKLLENDFHLSYPFTFVKDNCTYMIPENSKNGCWLYKLELESFKGKIFPVARKIKKLLSGHAIDPTLITYEGFDYLFVSSLIYESQYVLNVFICKNILSEDFRPHPQSPLLVNVNFGRSAGRIFLDKNNKTIIRPSQICDYSYGGGIAFSELILTPKKIIIKEMINKFITPRKYAEFKKVHHIDKFKNFSALDFVR